MCMCVCVWCWYLIPDHKLQITEKKIAGLRVISSCNVVCHVVKHTTKHIWNSTYTWWIDYFTSRIEDRYTLLARRLVFYCNWTFICRYCTGIWQEKLIEREEYTIRFIISKINLQSGLNILVYYRSTPLYIFHTSFINLIM